MYFVEHQKVLEIARNELDAFMEGNELFSSKMNFLYTSLEEGIPSEGIEYMRPFLSNSEYKTMINKMFSCNHSIPPFSLEAIVHFLNFSI